MASYHDAASLLLLELGLARVLPLDLVRAYFVFTLRVFLLLLFFRGQQRDQLHGGGTGRHRRHQVQGLVFGIVSLLLDVDFGRVLLQDQGNARILLY